MKYKYLRGKKLLESSLWTGMIHKHVTNIITTDINVKYQDYFEKTLYRKWASILQFNQFSLEYFSPRYFLTDLKKKDFLNSSESFFELHAYFSLTISNVRRYIFQDTHTIVILLNILTVTRKH